MFVAIQLNVLFAKMVIISPIIVVYSVNMDVKYAKVPLLAGNVFLVLFFNLIYHAQSVEL
mgnify:CR=1 FL=1